MTRTDILSSGDSGVLVAWSDAEGVCAEVITLEKKVRDYEETWYNFQGEKPILKLTCACRMLAGTTSDL